ncbi:MAG: hypothetical protein IH859_06755 [Chloroflexi bacterium]|nr:hypothetical protein [Chloroflexota bacterium]
MTSRIRARLLFLGLFGAAVSVVCSSSYITPKILTATAEAARAEDTPVPTAFFIFPSSTVTSELTATETPDPHLFTPTPEVEAATATEEPTPLPTTTLLDASGPPFLYTSQSGDTLNTLASRFGVNPIEIVSPEPIPSKGLINPGQIFMIPWRMGITTPIELILPDSEIVYSASVGTFDVVTYVNTLGGYLSTYRDYFGSRGWMSGGEIVQRVAVENSINPRILLALLEYQGNWVLGRPNNLSETDYPMGYINLQSDGLFPQLVWAVNQLSSGYYGWRAGTLVELRSIDGSSTRIAPQLNAGSVAIQYFFNALYSGDQWRQAVDSQGNFVALYNDMFGGDPWVRAAQVEPLFPPGLTQPEMILPFLKGQRWSYTGGPHGAWEGEGSQAALDFAPGSVETGCAKSDNWVLAASVILALIIIEDKGLAYAIHAILGVAALVLVLFRLVWGFAGGELGFGNNGKPWRQASLVDQATPHHAV